MLTDFDFDIETSTSSKYFPAMIKTLRSAFATDSKNTYYITGAPQWSYTRAQTWALSLATLPSIICLSNGTITTRMHRIHVRCLITITLASFNYDDWVKFTAKTPSKDAKIFIGVPASKDAANGTPAGATYYITPDQLSELIGKYGSATRFGGLMMWSAGFSDSNVIDDCTYAQQGHSILTTGKPCGGGGGSSSSNSSSTSSASTSSASTSTASASSAAAASASASRCVNLQVRQLRAHRPPTASASTESASTEAASTASATTASASTASTSTEAATSEFNRQRQYSS